MRLEGFTRTDPAFFSRPTTARVISEIADADPLVIYFGAGVTLSETGLTWSDMTARLLEKLDVKSASEKEGLLRLAGKIPPAQQASILMEFYTSKYGRQALNRLLIDIEALIYRGQQWRSGEYSKALTLLSDALLRDNRPPRLFTTNYDAYLELAPDQLRSELPGLAVNFSGTAEDGDSQVFTLVPQTSTNVVDIVHVHGLVIDHSNVPGHGLGATGTHLVFAERDYHRSQNRVVDALSRAFEGSNVLILGSGLDDPPLLRALAESKSLKRWAVLPRAALRSDIGMFDVSRAEQQGDVALSLSRRARQFGGLKLIVPDFFSQAAQFVREIACAVEAGPYPVTPATGYMMRLQQWWDRWAAAHIDPSDIEERQQDAHRVLSDAVAEVRTITGNGSEHLKIEMWVRWEPAERNLKLWASSTGTWPDTETARQVPIQLISNYAAVQAFVAGEILLSDTDQRSDRWSRYFAVPVRESAAAQAPVVGVITIATADNDGNTTISDENPDVLSELAQLMRRLASRVL